MLIDRKFHGMPFPPTTNNLFKNFVRNGKMLRVTTDDYKEYKKEFAEVISDKKYEKSINKVQSYVEQNYTLKLSLTFYFNRKQVFCKDGSLKKNDVTNRIKAIEDCLCDALGIDDKQFFFVSCAKMYTDGEAYVDVEVSKIFKFKQ